jgi:tRNA nucleotidyltransferase (CCA-adding enzyme)
MEEAIREEIERKPPFGRSDLAVNGETIMNSFHLAASPLIGEVINYLMERVLDDPAENQPDILLRHAGEFLRDKGYDQNVK